MEGVSIAASVVGVTTAALQSIHLLVQTIDGVKGAPNIIKAVSADPSAVQSVLQSLKGDPSHIVLSKEIEHAIQNCDRACGAFRLQVEHWMERSTQNKVFWMDRRKVGLFGLERIKMFREQLGDCKGTLSVVLTTATVYFFLALMSS